MTSRSTVAASATNTIRCDICLRKDDWKGMYIQQCHSCGVCVHEVCYGVIITTEKNKKWKCWACLAVGTEIQGHKINNHKLKTMKQEERPTECILCAVKDGVHAMHALYHDHGPDGRQVVLPKGGKMPQRLAWVHTLCALTVCSHRGTQGSVYGCDKDGDYEGSDPIHHFVMCGLNEDPEEDSVWVKMLNDHRSLTCTLCGQNETTAGRNLRVPLQCCAGDEDEFPEFKTFHRTIGEPCTQAMHVGCAMWGTKGNPPQFRRMYFYPGSEDDDGVYQDPVTEIFCDLHARQMNATTHGIRGASLVEKSTGGLLLYVHGEDLKPHDATVLPAYTCPSMERRASQEFTKGATPTSGSKGNRGAIPRKQAASAKPVSSVHSVTKAAPLRRLSDASKTSQSRKSKSPTAVTTTSIPRKKSSLASGGTAAASTAAPQSQSPAPARGRYTSPILNHEVNPAVSSTNAAGAATQKSTKVSVHSSEPAASPTSHVTPSATKGASAEVMESTKHVSIASSASLKGTQAESTVKLKPLIEGCSAKHVKDSGRAVPLIPPVKRRRKRSISKEKQSDKDVRSSNADGETNQDSNLWMSDDVQGQLVETEELPAIGAPPEGVNPWASLWEPGAPPFELDVIASAERRNTNGLN